MTVKEIIIKYLEENGFEGLHSEECGCSIDNLAACDENCLNCIPGYKHLDPNGEFNYVITESKEPPEIDYD
jgi:hypothetical protein